VSTGANRAFSQLSGVAWEGAGSRRIPSCRVIRKVRDLIPGSTATSDRSTLEFAPGGGGSPSTAVSIWNCGRTSSARPSPAVSSSYSCIGSIGLPTGDDESHRSSGDGGSRRRGFSLTHPGRYRDPFAVHSSEGSNSTPGRGVGQRSPCLAVTEPTFHRIQSPVSVGR
jgi:hypothetical protein